MALTTAQELALLKQQMIEQKSKPIQQQDTGAGSIMTDAMTGYGGEGGQGGDWLGGILGGLTGAAKYMGSSEGRNILAGSAAERGDRPMAGAYLTQAGTQEQKEAVLRQAIVQKEQQRQAEILGLAGKEEEMELERTKAASDIMGKTTEKGKVLSEAAQKGDIYKQIVENAFEGKVMPTEPTGLIKRTFTGEKTQAAKPQVMRTGLQYANK